jgi:glycosyltransferase involved in cell wall biosynthesis
MDDLKFSVYIPTRHEDRLLGGAINDVLAQTYGNFELIISDNASSADTERLVKSLHDGRIKYFPNGSDLGWTGSVELYRKRATGDILYLLSAKSRISRDALQKTYEAFRLSEDIAAVTRPYYWYGADVDTAVRAKARFDADKDTVISIQDGPEAVIAVFRTLDNPGGLAFRIKYIPDNVHFREEKFVEFTYPFAYLFKKHKVVYLKDYTMACPAFEPSASQTAGVYERSPVQNWVDMFNSVFYEDEFKEVRARCIRDFVAVNYVGLVQIRNYAGYGKLWREIKLLVKYRWQNLFVPQFWFFSLGTMVMPKKALIRLVSQFKDKVTSRILDDAGISLSRG